MNENVNLVIAVATVIAIVIASFALIHHLGNRACEGIHSTVHDFEAFRESRKKHGEVYALLLIVIRIHYPHLEEYDALRTFREFNTLTTVGNDLMLAAKITTILDFHGDIQSGWELDRVVATVHFDPSVYPNSANFPASVKP